MPRKRRFSEEAFGPTVERLMLGDRCHLPRPLGEDQALRGVSQPPRAREPAGSSNDVIETLAEQLGVEPEHFREYRLRVITEKLEAMPELIDRLYKRLGE